MNEGDNVVNVVDGANEENQNEMEGQDLGKSFNESQLHSGRSTRPHPRSTSQPIFPNSKMQDYQLLQYLVGQLIGPHGRSTRP